MDLQSTLQKNKLVGADQSRLGSSKKESVHGHIYREHEASKIKFDKKKREILLKEEEERKKQCTFQPDLQKSMKTLSAVRRSH